MTMTHEQAKIISDIGKWKIQKGDWVYKEKLKHLITETLEYNSRSLSSKQLTLIPQEKHLLELLRDNGIETNIFNEYVELCIYTNYEDNFKGFEIKDNNIHEALTDAVMYCIENNLIVKEG